jgi:hypothetical protein
LAEVTGCTWLFAFDTLVVDWGIAIDTFIEAVTEVEILQKLIREAVDAGERSRAELAWGVARHAFERVARVTTLRAP